MSFAAAPVLTLAPDQRLHLFCGGQQLSLFSEQSGSPRVAAGAALQLTGCAATAFPAVGDAVASGGGSGASGGASLRQAVPTGGFAALTLDGLAGTQLFGDLPGAALEATGCTIEHSSMVRAAARHGVLPLYRLAASAARRLPSQQQLCHVDAETQHATVS
jgi:hypothetical protein